MDGSDDGGAGWGVRDLHARLRLGLARGRGLWRSDEQAHVQAWLDLRGEAALAAARAAGWVVPGWPAARWSDEVAGSLLARGLVVAIEDRAVRRGLARREALVRAAQRVGCVSVGRVEEVRARLDAVDADVEGVFYALARPRLLRDVTRWATLRPWPDPSNEVLERLDRVRWPAYPIDGDGVVPARERWDAWADRMDEPGCGTLTEAVALLGAPWRPPGHLDVSGAVVRAWTEALLAAPSRDASGLRALAEVAGVHGVSAWVGAAEAFAAVGAWADAAETLQVASVRVRPIDRPALERCASRWVRLGLPRPAPRPPRRPAPRRDLSLVAAGDAGRRRWLGGGGETVIERAVVDHLAAHGRAAVAGEGALWRSVVGLLLAGPSFDVACGQLPVARLSGPLDAWTPSYAERRVEALERLREQVHAGRAREIVEAAVGRFGGCRLTGVRWRLLPAEGWLRVVEALPPVALWAMVEGFLREGRAFAIGLPDLVVLPGDPVCLAGAFPSKVGDGLLLVEVKGPTDALRDAQRVRHDQLLDMGLPVEVWYVRASQVPVAPTGVEDEGRADLERDRPALEDGRDGGRRRRARR